MDKIADGIYEVGPGYVNAYVVDGDEGVVLIDTGLPKKDDLITAGLVEVGRSIDDLTAILLTHSHNDHTGGAASIKAGSGATLIASRGDASAIRGDVPAPAPPMLWGPLALLARLMPKSMPVVVDHEVAEGSEDGLPTDFSVIDTPGHTPGHTSYLLDRAGGILFVGDAAAADKRGKITKGFPNAFGGPQIDESIRHIATFDFEMAVFGHAAPLTSGASKAFRAY